MLNGTRYFHVGLVVDDLDAAMAQLGAALGLEWLEPKAMPVPGQAEPLQVVFSRQGPPFFELMKGPPGSAWDPASGARVDHLGFWTGDLDSASQHLLDAGAPVVLDGKEHGMALRYHALPAAGLRVEVFDATEQRGFRERWGHEAVECTP